jgi:adenylate kinase
VALNLVFMGPPGAGKGTQAARFAAEFGIPKISTGDILREAVAAGTPLGRQVQALMERGELVSDDLMIDIVAERLSRHDVSRGFILDGFPRTVPQARALDALLEARGPVVAVEIQVPDEELVRRIVSRRVCGACRHTVSAFDAEGAALAACPCCGGQLLSRPDDTEEVVRERLKVYRRETQPMVAFYQTRSTYRAVDGAQPPDRVHDAIVDAIADVLGKPPAELLEHARVAPESNA